MEIKISEKLYGKIRRVMSTFILDRSHDEGWDGEECWMVCFENDTLDDLCDAYDELEKCKKASARTAKKTPAVKKTTTKKGRK